MSQLSDLTGNTENTGNGLADGVLMINNPNIHERSTKNNTPTDNVTPQAKPSVVDFQKTPVAPNPDTQSVLSFSSIVTPTDRKPADLSNLPKEKLAGVDQHLSKEDDVFHEGGPFDQYRENKIKEMQEVNQLIDEHNAKVAAMRGEEIPTDEELKKIGTEDLTSALKGTKYYNQSDWINYMKEQKENAEAKQRSSSDLDDMLSNDSDDDKLSMEDEMNPDNNEEVKKAPASIKDLEDTSTKEPEYDLDDSDEEEVADVDVNEQMKALDSYLDQNADEDTKKASGVEEAHYFAYLADEEKNVVPEEIKKANTEAKVDNTPDDLKSKEAELNEKVKLHKVEDEIDLDFDDAAEEDDEETAKKDEENLKELQQDAASKIKPFKGAIDFNKFKRVNTPVAVSKDLFETTKQVAFDWVLPATGIKIGMSKFKADEIETISNTEGQTDFSSQKEIYKLFYDHIVSPKPKKFEQWLKTISYSDDDNLYFCAFGATFGGSLYMPYDCDKCKKTYLSEKLKFEDLYSIEKEEDKKKVKELLNDEYSKPLKLYKSEEVQISDMFVFEFREPSIYNAVFEQSLLTDEFKEKYSDTINLISYIDNIEMIDYTNMTLHPVKVTSDPNHVSIGVKSRIIEYSKIIRSLTSDQKGLLISYLSTIGNKTPKIEFHRPASTCPNCGNEIPKRTMRAQTMLFTRAQLGVLIHTSLN